MVTVWSGFFSQQNQLVRFRKRSRFGKQSTPIGFPQGMNPKLLCESCICNTSVPDLLPTQTLSIFTLYSSFNLVIIVPCWYCTFIKVCSKRAKTWHWHGILSWIGRSVFCLWTETSVFAPTSYAPQPSLSKAAENTYRLKCIYHKHPGVPGDGIELLPVWVLVARL